MWTKNDLVCGDIARLILCNIASILLLHFYFIISYVFWNNFKFFPTCNLNLCVPFRKAISRCLARSARRPPSWSPPGRRWGSPTGSSTPTTCPSSPSPSTTAPSALSTPTGRRIAHPELENGLTWTVDLVKSDPVKKFIFHSVGGIVQPTFVNIRPLAHHRLRSIRLCRRLEGRGFAHPELEPEHQIPLK